MSASLGPICFNGSLNFLHRLAAPVPEVSSEEVEEDDESQKWQHQDHCLRFFGLDYFGTFFESCTAGEK